MAVNAVLLIAVVGFVSSAQPAEGGIKDPALNALSVQEINPLDQLSSADIAVNVARMAGLEQATAVTNQADSAQAQLASSVQSDTRLIAKPQILNTTLKSRYDIEQYTAKAGDTVSALAERFNVTSDSIRWSNNISGTVVPAGKVIYVLPGVNGIIYTVKQGDTPEGLAGRYGADKNRIIAMNDAELSGLPIGKRIIIPDGKPPVYVAPARSYFGLAFGSSPIYGYNGYDRGYCTYYAASRVSVPTNWSHAKWWDDGARASGWTVSSEPVKGAIAQTHQTHYLGHVAYVEAVSADKKMIKYSDMNGLAGFGTVGYSGWVPASKFENYIYR